MKILALDSNSLINRAFFAVRPLSAPNGTPTNALFGFLSTLFKLKADEAPDFIYAAFDLPVPTHRHKLFQDYKAGRADMPEDLKTQMPIARQILTYMGIPCLDSPGWEADDILGTIAAQCQTKGAQCVIATGDKDALQLISNSTSVRLVKTKAGQTVETLYTSDIFRDEYGFEPERLIDFKALMGDSSDNIPGVPGVGVKTATTLMQSFGSLSAVYDNLDSGTIKASVREKLEKGRESADMSYMLAAIKHDAPIQFDPTAPPPLAPDNDELYKLFSQLGFSKFIEKLGLTSDKPHKPRVLPPVVRVNDRNSLNAMIGNITAANICFTALGGGSRDISAIAILPQGAGCIYTVSDSELDIFRAAITAILSGDVKKAGHSIKDTMTKLGDLGYPQEGWCFDTELAAYLLEPTASSYSLAQLAVRYCDFKMTHYESNAQLSLLDAPSDDFILQSAADEAAAIELLYNALTPRLQDQGLCKLLYDIELPLCIVLSDMERAGFKVDRAALSEFGESLLSDIKRLELEIYDAAGETFTIASPKQLSRILFEKLKLPAPKKTKTGYSTNSDVLDSLENRHPIIALIKEYRENTKLKSTYADGLLKQTDPNDRIHTNFKMTVTATGRLSSTDPNLQNIPIRKDKGGKLRQMFIAEPGNVLIDADYSQIELKLLAHLSGDEGLIRAFENGEDIHTVTASSVFGVEPFAVSSTQRSRAKAVNFGIVYGISAFSLAQDIGVTHAEAKQYIEGYLSKYSGVSAYMKAVVMRAKETGFAETLFGRRRALPELSSSNHNIRAFGERVALNMPIQGSAADIIKLAMLGVYKSLKQTQPNARLILQVHDELIVECSEGDADSCAELLRREMENAVTLSIPLTVTISKGRTWSK